LAVGATSSAVGSAVESRVAKVELLLERRQALKAHREQEGKEHLDPGEGDTQLLQQLRQIAVSALVTFLTAWILWRYHSA